MSDPKTLLPLVAVVGPTASGKSALGVWLAERLCGEVVACDSTQLYRGFDIGTAKPSASERCGVPHHLIDVLGPQEEATAGGYRERQFAIASRSRFFLWPQHIDQMMRDPAALGSAGLGSPNIESAIKLRRIAGHHFSAQPLGEPDTQRGLAGSRRANDGNKRQKSFRIAHRKKMWRARKTKTTSTTRARSRLPRTCWRETFTLPG